MSLRLFLLGLLILILPLSANINATENPIPVDQIKDFYESLKLPANLDGFAVKGTQPQLFSTFSHRHISAFSGRGNKAESDLLSSDELSMLAILTSDVYRNEARILFIDKNARLGFPRARFVSLVQFKQDVLPVLDKIMSGSDQGLAKTAMEIANKADSLAGMAWESLPIFPPAEGRKWATPAEYGSNATDVINALRLTLNGSDTKGYSSSLEKLIALAANCNPENGLPQLNLQLERLFTAFDFSSLAFWIILAATACYITRVTLSVKVLAPVGLILSILGTLLLLITLVIRSILAGHLPVTSLYEYLSVTAFAVMLVYLAFYIFTRQIILGALANPVALLLIVTASLFPSEIESQLVPALQSFWLEVHVTMAALGEGAFAIGAVCSVLYLILRKAKPRADGSIPNVNLLDSISYRAIAVGYPLFTIGALVAGAIWAEVAWGAWWSWDPKETGAFVVWILASLYLHARLNRGWKGTRTAVLAILIFIFAILTLLANQIFGGLHSYGVN